MEQQFKADGLRLSNRKAKKTKKGLSNRKAMNEDRISELPDALLLQILSSLPTDNAITTSVLSKRWRSVWKMVPILKFDSHQVLHNRDFRLFSENVYRCLTLHKAPFLESLHLKFKGKIDCVDVEFEDRTDCVDVGIWIATAFARRVRKLVLVRAYQEEQIVTLPSVLFTYNDTLEILKLKYSIAIDFPSRVCLKSLKKLCLYQVRFQDEESVSNFLCGCPSLEDLDMYRYRESYTNVATFTIAVPSLQRLTLDDGYYGDGIGGYVINAPSLKYLNINGFHGFEFCLIENAPELLEAEITEVSDITDENILESLTSAKRLSLSLSPSEIMPPTGKIFYQLLSLELSTKGKESWNLLSLMLSCSPKLQILKLFWFNSLYGDRNCPIDCKWNQPKCVPDCLLFHLETFVWTRYDWQREDEKEVATYILNNAKCLKKATFSEFGNSENLEKRREMLNELANVVRASDVCHLLFE